MREKVHRGRMDSLAILPLRAQSAFVFPGIPRPTAQQPEASEGQQIFFKGVCGKGWRWRKRNLQHEKQRWSVSPSSGWAWKEKKKLRNRSTKEIHSVQTPAFTLMSCHCREPSAGDTMPTPTFQCKPHFHWKKDAEALIRRQPSPSWHTPQFPVRTEKMCTSLPDKTLALAAQMSAFKVFSETGWSQWSGERATYAVVLRCKAAEPKQARWTKLCSWICYQNITAAR